MNSQQENTSIVSEKEKLWRTPIKGAWFIVILTILILATSLKFSFKSLIWFPSTTEATTKIFYDYIDLIIYGLWIIVPPLFFLFEYVYLFGKDEKNRLDPIQREDLKYCQDLGSKIWAAIAVFFSILLFVKYGIKLG